MIYKPVKGSTLNNDQAQRYGERLALLEEEHGGVTPDKVLTDAQSKKSPLHEFFQWDNKAAAHSYRLDQARYLLRSINVVVKREEEEEEVRAFHPVTVKVVTPETNGNGQSYVSLQRVMSDDEWKREVIEKAFRELEAWRKKYATYVELAQAVQTVGAILQQKVI